LSSTTALASGVSIFKKLPFDPQRDFSPIALVVHQPYVLVVHPSLPTPDLEHFTQFVKARPGQLNYGSSGAGGGQHLAAEMFMSVTGTKLEPVAYKGGAPALVDLLAGRVGIMFETVPTVIDYIKIGKLRALAVTAPRRVNMLPAVPTMREAGTPVEFRNWMALAGPAGMPRDVIARLNAETVKIIKGDLAPRFADLGLDPGGGTPEELMAFIRDEIAKYAKLVKASGMEPL
jgi:tripartite-type tricarboxylate transporter receptor subunit TctC